MSTAFKSNIQESKRPSGTCAKIIPGLWIGSLLSLRDIEKMQENDSLRQQWIVVSLLGSEKMILMAKALLAASAHLKYCRHEIWQLPDRSNGGLLSQKLSSTLEIIDQCVDLAGSTSENVRPQCLVHCAQGLSRSAAVCTAWLISRKNMSLEDALNQMRNVRPQICPNLGFLAELKALECCCGNVQEAIERMKVRQNKI